MAIKLLLSHISCCRVYHKFYSDLKYDTLNHKRRFRFLIARKYHSLSRKNLRNDSSRHESQNCRLPRKNRRNDPSEFADHNLTDRQGAWKRHRSWLVSNLDFLASAMNSSWLIVGRQFYIFMRWRDTNPNATRHSRVGYLLIYIATCLNTQIPRLSLRHV